MIIIGAGAAGLCAAILLGRKGVKVTLLEQNDRVGKKILVSGNGKCNITNRHISTARFHSQNPGFVEEVLKGYAYPAVETFFHSIGLVLTEGKEGKMFPLSMQASSVAALLRYAAEEADVDIVCHTQVTHITHDNAGFHLRTSQGDFSDTHLLIASGSLAAPKLGGSNAGYVFAQKMGHTLIPRHPALVQLCSKETWIKSCAGVKLPAVATLYANKEQVVQKEGDILFTAYGISGLAILDLSREASLRLAQFDYCELSLDIMPSFTKEQLTNLLLSGVNTQSEKPVSLWLQGFIHQKLIPHILKTSKCRAATEKMLNRKEIGKLVYALKNLKLGISDTRGFEHAEVATGGVNTAEVDPVTMVSRHIPNLYFAGEVLDVDGDRGGFNFHFAWVGAMRVAKAV
jgi:predicted Rossmann fold flavoprotein